MKIEKARAEILGVIDGRSILQHIEQCGRVCCKSENKIEKGSAERLIRDIIKRGHESVLEHASVSVRFVVDRGVSHELVRHRIASYSQESTRYCNYADDKFGKEITVIEPCFSILGTDSRRYWEIACIYAEKTYFALLERGWSPQEARSVLPNSLKTEVIMTANLREWRHFFRLRTDRAAHPQMREVTIPLLCRLQDLIPVVFDDIKLPAEVWR